jgi:hypothetical protein
MNPLKWLLNLLPQDPSDEAGWGPFRLPADADWMQRAARLHDIEFRESVTSGRRLSEVDSDLFWRWALLARNAEDPMEQCRRMKQICKYWPIARKVGRYFFDG